LTGVAGNPNLNGVHLNTVQVRPKDPSMTMAESSTTSTEPTRPARRRSTTTDIALIAAFAALISACAYIGALPVGGAGVPITLQTFGVMLAGCVLGPVRGFLAVSLYLLLGALGLPVFAEHSSGLAVFSGPSAGYLIAFPFAAALAGFLVKYVARERRTRAIWVFGCSLAGSVLVIHPLGILGMKLYFDVSWHQALLYDTPFWIGDILKTTLVALIAAEVFRAFPSMQRIDR
jgi:biotin transport system substrate-specific component